LSLQTGPVDAARGVGYAELLRSNRSFRRLWIADIASLFGDWLNTIALYTLVRELTASPFALGFTLVIKVLPFALASPFAGFLVDRFDRRLLMVVADLARALIVLGFMVIDEPSEIGWLYALAALQMIVSAVFIPARSAVIPNITSARELLTANALSAMTWSSLLAVGAALGGFVTAWLGVQAVFILDSLSYVVSAAFVLGVVVPKRSSDREAELHPLRDIVAGWQYVRAHPAVGRAAIVKGLWAAAGGGLVYLLTLIGERLPGVETAVGIGLLYGARGLGTGVGPILVRSRFPDSRVWPSVIGAGLLISAVAYGVVAVIPWGLWVLPWVMLAHTPSGANWVLSTVLLQKRAVDEFRGRVFATEWLFITLVDSVSILAASWILERGWLDLRAAILTFSGGMVVAAALWWMWAVPAERRSFDAATATPFGE